MGQALASLLSRVHVDDTEWLGVEWFADPDVQQEAEKKRFTRSLSYVLKNGKVVDAKTRLEYLDMESAYQAQSKADRNRNNSLQYILLHQVSWRTDAVVELLLKHLPKQYLISLITHTNLSGQNCLQIATKRKLFQIVFRLQRHLSDECFYDNVELILSGNNQFMVTRAIEWNDYRILNKLTNSYPSVVKEWLDQNFSPGLSTWHIKIMAPATDTYIIPAVQTHARRHAIVCYNPLDREGAFSEAQQLASALKKIRIYGSSARVDLLCQDERVASR